MQLFVNKHLIIINDYFCLSFKYLHLEVERISQTKKTQAFKIIAQVGKARNTMQTNTSKSLKCHKMNNTYN